jgi:hypothetical protein
VGARLVTLHHQPLLLTISHGCACRAQAGQTSSLRLLHSYGISLLPPQTCGGATPVHTAARCGAVGVLELLVRRHPPTPLPSPAPFLPHPSAAWAAIDGRQICPHGGGGLCRCACTERRCCRLRTSAVSGRYTTRLQVPPCPACGGSSAAPQCWARSTTAQSPPWRRNHSALIVPGRAPAVAQCRRWRSRLQTKHAHSAAQAVGAAREASLTSSAWRRIVPPYPALLSGSPAPASTACVTTGTSRAWSSVAWRRCKRYSTLGPASAWPGCCRVDFGGSMASPLPSAAS